MSEDYSRLVSVPNDVLDERALQSRAVTTENDDSLVCSAIPAVQERAVEEVDTGILKNVTRLLQLDQELRQESIVTLVKTFSVLWDQKEQNIQNEITALQTVATHPFDFGKSFLTGFLSTYLQDIITLAKCTYESALLLAYLNECLGNDVYFQDLELGLNVARYLEIGDILEKADACKPLEVIVKSLDDVVTKIAKFFDENGDLLHFADYSLNLVNETLDFLISLVRSIPEMTEGPLQEYAEKTAKDPVALGRIMGIVGATAVGFAFGVEEIAVTATGIKALHPIIVGGGIVGGLMGGDDEVQRVEVKVLHPLNAVSGGTRKLLINTFTELTEQERRLIIFFMTCFERARNARALEHVGREADAVMQAMTHAGGMPWKDKLALFPEMARFGRRAVDEASMLATKDLAQHHIAIKALMKKMEPLVRNAIQNARFEVGSYGSLRYKLRALNEQTERLYYLANIDIFKNIDEIEALKRTGQLHQSLFEAAHIVDAKFVNLAENGDWASVNKFKEKIPTWFKGGKPAPNAMPSIALLATEHTQAPGELKDVWGIFKRGEDYQTVTSAMEGLIAIEGSPNAIQKVKDGAFLVTRATTATEIVRVQELIYKAKFPEIYGKVSGELDRVLQALDETVQLTWSLPKG